MLAGYIAITYAIIRFAGKPNMPTHNKRFPDRSHNNLSYLYNGVITYCQPRILISSNQLTYYAYRRACLYAKHMQASNPRHPTICLYDEAVPQRISIDGKTQSLAYIRN